MACHRFLLAFLLVVSVVFWRSTAEKIKVVTWNVADNKQMGGSFTDEAIDKVLHLGWAEGEQPAIYAIGLEENCWKCNEKNLPKLGNRFLDRINKRNKESIKYYLVGVMGTRMAMFCEATCKTKINLHGTTALVVIAKTTVVTEHKSFRQNKGCHKSWFANKEKGIAGIKVETMGGKSLCFGAGHLDSASAPYRRQCFEKFLETAHKKNSWNDCDARFLFGDFNTRTGPKTGESKEGMYIPTYTDFNAERDKDELAGTNPYGTDKDWHKNLLAYINYIQNIKISNDTIDFKECPFNFIPTYSIEKSAKRCSDAGGQFPCYRKSRPRSWTDRILYDNKDQVSCLRYEAILEEYGDHLPVYADFSMDISDLPSSAGARKQ